MMITEEKKKDIEIKEGKVDERAYGMDALRILSMLMVIVLHLCGHGGVVALYERNTARYNVAWLIQLGAFCSVNLFALTSGYLMVNHRFKTARIIRMWLQVVFYSVTISLVFRVFKGEFGWKFWVKSFFPVTLNTWWYFSVYFALSFLIPFINKLLVILSKRQTAFLVAFILIVGSLVSGGIIPFFEMEFSTVDTFGFSKGFSLFWVMGLYIVGAFVRKYDVGGKVKKWWYLLVYAVALFLVWHSRIWIGEWNGTHTSFVMPKGCFVSYVSPFVTVMAISLLLFFAKLRFPKPVNKVLKFASPLAFGVYIIHEHPLVREYCITERFVFLADDGVGVLIGTLFITPLIIFAACILIEYLRAKLFEILGINKQVNKLGAKIDAWVKDEKKKEEK